MLDGLDGLAAASESTPEDADALFNELLEEKYTPIELCQKGHEILMIICKHGHIEALHLLLEEIGIHTCFDINKSKAILTAANHDDPDTALTLVTMINGYYFNNEGDSDYFLAAFDTALKSISIEMVDLLYCKMRPENKRVKLASLMNFVCSSFDLLEPQAHLKTLNLLDTIIKKSPDESDKLTIYNIILMQKSINILRYVKENHPDLIPTTGKAFSRVLMDKETPNECLNIILERSRLSMQAVSKEQWIILFKNNHIFIGADQGFKEQFNRLEMLIHNGHSHCIPQNAAKEFFHEYADLLFDTENKSTSDNNELNTILKLIKHDILDAQFVLNQLCELTNTHVSSDTEECQFLWELFNKNNINASDSSKRKVLIILLAYKHGNYFVYFADKCDKNQYDAAFFLKITKGFIHVDPFKILSYMPNYGYALLTRLSD